MTKEASGELLNVREVARYLGINEKKVYFLAKTGKIPCTRVTGKWTFPKNLVAQWIEQSASAMVARSRAQESRAYILAAGSDDPSLGILRELYEAQAQPASFFMATLGSSVGLQALQGGAVDVALAHLLEPARPMEGRSSNRRAFPGTAAVVALFHRELGLLVARGNPLRVGSIRDLARGNVRYINRQSGSGTRIYFDQELLKLRIKPQKIFGYGTAVSTHIDVGLQILRGDADVGLATRTAAQLSGLDFIPLTRERFDLCVRKESFFESRIQALLAVVGSREFRRRVHDMGGYDVTESGRIIRLQS
ncbi:MAG TPA: helix-turn-helix transcriptional regulator [Candidatus Binatia bacterium]|nr:helix-turn-helix transcriptional regulator [Candidatus Binatia bacterium]